MSEGQRECAHCRGPVTNRGRKVATGRYFCGKADCQKAKQRERYRQRTLPDERREAPRRCYNCGMALKPRLQRTSDTPGKRWCNATDCRMNRAAVLMGDGDGMPTQQALEQALLRISFLQAAAYPNMRVTCGVCGRDDAVTDYLHPDDDLGQRCVGTGSGYVHIQDARSVWPAKLGAPDWMLKEIQRQIEAGRLAATED